MRTNRRGHHGRVYAAVLLFAVVAFIVVRIFRPVHPESVRTEPEATPETATISTQVFSFRVDAADLAPQPEDSQNLLMGIRRERPPTPIYHSIPAKADLEVIKNPKPGEFRPDAPFQTPGESIVVE